MEIALRDSYLGNQNLKKANVKRNWTIHEIQEIVKCNQDPIYMIENYFKVVSLDQGLVHFKLYDYQKDIIKTCLKNNFVICNLGRQMGKTVSVGAFILTEALFNENYTIAILANKAATAREILDRVKMMFEYLPEFLKPGVKEWNKGSVEFGNGSKIFAAATTSTSIRGKSCNLVALDEFGFVENAEEFYTSTFPVISSGKSTKVIITSTPNGMNLFYKILTEAKNKLNSYIPLEYDWSHDPRKDEAWKEATIRNIGKRNFDQEFGIQFAGSASTLISGDKLQQLTYINPIEEKDNIKIYKYPIIDNSYVISVDVSEGIGKDYSVITVIDITRIPYEVVLVFRSNTIEPLTLAKTVNQIANKYNEGFLIIENNSIGKIVADSLFNDYEYENIISDKNATNYRLGVRTTTKTKSIGCSSLKTIIENDLIVLNDFDILSEIFSFVKKNNSFQAENNSKTDDTIMTLVLFAWFVQEQQFQEYTDNTITQVIHDTINSEDDHLIFGFLDDGIENNNEF